MLAAKAARALRPEVLDSAEKYVLSAAFTFFAYRMINDYLQTGSLVTLVYFVDQMIVLVFIVFRRKTDAISLRRGDWFAGFAGTFLALLIGPASGEGPVPPFVAGWLLLCGFAVHIAAKLTLRRSFGVVAANRGVKASGPYRVVRHPMYLGYIILQTGILLAGPTLNNVVVIGLSWAFYVWRIEAEERVLRADPSYATFAGRTRYRLLPGIY